MSILSILVDLIRFSAKVLQGGAIFMSHWFIILAARFLHHIVYPTLSPIVMGTFDILTLPFRPLSWWFSWLIGAADDPSLCEILLREFKVSWRPYAVQCDTPSSIRREDPTLWDRRTWRKTVMQPMRRGRRRFKKWGRTGGRPYHRGLRRIRGPDRGSSILKPPDGLILCLRRSLWSIFIAPYKYVMSKARKPPDIEDIADFVTVVAIALIPVSFSSFIMRSWWRIIQIKIGWLKVPPTATKPADTPKNKRTVLATINVFTAGNELPSVQFDDDGSTVVLDNSATGHICNTANMYVGTIRPVENDAAVATINGKDNSPSGVGTVDWNWRDDDGVLHTHRFEDVLYFPQSPVNILSVTCFAEQLKDLRRTRISTGGMDSIFTWDQNKYRRTIVHPESGLPELPVNEGYTRFHSFCSLLSKYFPTPRFAFCSAFTSVPQSIGIDLVTDDEGGAANREGGEANHEGGQIYDSPNEPVDASPPNTSGTTVDFAIGSVLQLNMHELNLSTPVKLVDIDAKPDGTPIYVVKDTKGNKYRVAREHLQHFNTPDIAKIPTTPDDLCAVAPYLSKDQLVELYKCVANPSSLTPVQEEFLSWHNRLGHMPFAQMKRLADRGALPRRFAKVSCPKCASCLFGKQHRRPWRTSKSDGGSIRQANDDAPGKRTSIDQLVSAQPGLVPLASGYLSSDRIVGATIFVDHFTGYVYTHLMRSLSGDETLAAKAAYEKLADDYGVSVSAYHADNGRFAESSFRNAVDESNQTITFCGVGAHHQNAIVERMIKELTLGARSMLLHAHRYWPEYISTMLWPLALKCTTERINTLDTDETGKTPIEKFSGVDALPVVKHYHTWGCPVYCLDARLQSGPKSIPKWEPRSRLGVYLGHSPVHAGSVALVLNPATGHVSPQYHCVYDDDFTTVPYLRDGTVPPHWAELCATSTEIATDEAFVSSIFEENALLPDAVDSTCTERNNQPEGQVSSLSLAEPSQAHLQGQSSQSQARAQQRCRRYMASKHARSTSYSHSPKQT